MNAPWRSCSRLGASVHIPGHVSDGARDLLKRMVCVDPLKRATIVEIQHLPFFQEELPRYLQPLPDVERYPTLPMDDLNTLVLINEGKADPRKVAESKGLVYTEDLGVVDPTVVNELLEKISTYDAKDVWRALQKDGDNQVKVAYQLVRDHRRIIKDCMCEPRFCADTESLISQRWTRTTKRRRWTTLWRLRRRRGPWRWTAPRPRSRLPMGTKSSIWVM